jgi:hypothetical protein
MSKPQQVKALLAQAHKALEGCALDSKLGPQQLFAHSEAEEIIMQINSLIHEWRNAVNRGRL